MSLSILICTLPEREEKFKTLYANLRQQYNKLDSTNAPQILHDARDNSIPVGAKRNALLERATGDYVCFIDDDDCVHAQYVEKILHAIRTKPDCVGIVGDMMRGGEKVGQFKHSIRYCGWYRGADGIFYRTPNHLNPIRRRLAMITKFPAYMRNGEDHIYSRLLQPYLKTEVMIDEPMYFYNMR